MSTDHFSMVSLAGLAVLTAALAWERLRGERWRGFQCLGPLWIFFLALGLAAWWTPVRSCSSWP